MGLHNPVPVIIGAATAAAGAVTLHEVAGKLTSEALVTAAGAAYTLTLTCRHIHAKSLVLASIQQGTSTTGEPDIRTITITEGQAVFKIQNEHATVALNGTLIVAFLVIVGSPVSA
jgi:hypothetical protein